MLAQRDMTIGAVNAAFDPSQGTISQGGALSLTAGTISIGGTWNYGGQSVSINGLNGITNGGTMTGTAPLTISTGGTFANYGQVIGQDVTFNGALFNAAGAVMHAGGALAINGKTTNRGTVESAGALTVSGGSYDNQGATTQTQGNATFNLGGTLLNTGGSIFAGNNIVINAGAVVNDQTAPTGTTTTTTVNDPSLLWSSVVGTANWSYIGVTPGDSGQLAPVLVSATATLGDLLSPTGSAGTTQSVTLTGWAGISDGPIPAQSATSSACYNVGLVGCQDSLLAPPSSPVSGAGSVTFGAFTAVVGQSGDSGNPTFGTVWIPETGRLGGETNVATLSLPTVHETVSTGQVGTSGVISAGGSISLTAGTLSNRGGQIAAQGNVSLNVQSLINGAVAPTQTSRVTDWVDPGQFSAFLSAVSSLWASSGGPSSAFQYGCVTNCATVVTIQLGAASAASTTSSLTWSTPTGMVASGNDLTVTGGNLVNAGLLYAGNNVLVQAASLTNQGGNQQNQSTSVGCASGVPNSACDRSYGSPRGSNPTTTTFSYAQNDATIYAGHDLVIAAGQVDNTFANLLAGHDIVVGGVGTTAGSTTPASSLNNTSGNIVAGNNITLNVSGAITNNLPPPVLVHQNYGSKEQYTGCMTAGGYKESYCEAYVDQQSGTSSVISAGNNLKINAGSLTNIGSLISAGSTATINVAGPVINEAQTLNAYWHSHWVQETGDFSADKRHDVWACGSTAECIALYGAAYTHVGGAINPPQPVGNIAATIEAPNLTITSGGEIQNVGNVLGTSVALTGQRLINGITTANTYTPRVNAPSQVISLSPATLPGLNISLPRAAGTGAVPTAVAGQASFVDASLGGTSQTTYSPQVLLSNLPSNLQPSSTLFYYNPQEEDLLLQQAALQQTGKATFVDGLSYDSQNNLSVTEQEKGYLYGNALDYAKANNIQLGQALTQAQVTALDRPMLWYVEQTVPDPSCSAVGKDQCPTITALMPQVYLPSTTTALSAGGNIQGTDVTLNFDKNGQGSILNTGSIAASGTLTVNTQSLTNQANQVDVGNLWSQVKGGYVDTSGTQVQPGGFMSAANMDLNVQTLNQIGGALQKLNADGTVDLAGTQQLLAALQQQLGGNFTQTSVSDNLHTSFTAEGGFGVQQVIEIAVAIALSVVTAGAGAALVGAATGSLEAAVANAAFSALVSSLASDVMSGNFSLTGIAESVGIAVLTAGITNGITVDSTTGSLGVADWAKPVGNGVETLGQMAGAAPAVGTSVAQATQATAATLSQQAMAIAAQSALEAGVQTAIKGGSYLQNFESDAVTSVAAIAANDIGNFAQAKDSLIPTGSIGYDLAHAALGCASSAALGTGCAGGAIGGATSALVAPWLVEQAGGSNTLTEGQRAAIVGISTLLGGVTAGLAGQNAQAGATAAANESLNNATSTKNPDYAAKMLGYDRETFGDMIHAMKFDLGLRGDDNVVWHINGDVEFRGQVIGNMHDY
jgi:filamentous hemagglutinin